MTEVDVLYRDIQLLTYLLPQFILFQLKAIITVAIAVLGIIGTLVVARPDLISNSLSSGAVGEKQQQPDKVASNPLQKVFVTGLVNDDLILQAGESKSFGINTSNSRGILLQIIPKNSDAQLHVNVYYLAGQNDKTFNGKQLLTYYVSYDQPLDVDIVPEQNSKVIVDIEPASRSDIHLEISLHYVL